MPALSQFAGRLLMRIPPGSAGVRSVPVLGGLVHRLSHWLVPSGRPLWTQVRGGLAEGMWLELNPRTGRDYSLGRVERKVQDALGECLRPGMAFYDIGANIGFFSLVAARLVGSEGKVFAFEPEPELASRIRRHVQRNGLSCVSVVEAGVWSSSGTATLVRSDPASSPERGTGVLSSREGNGDCLSVRTIALDDFVRTAPPPQVIKCDAEGAEVEVLRGAVRLLADHRPAIVCELHSEGTLRTVRDFLSGYGYRLRDLDTHHVLALP